MSTPNLFKVAEVEITYKNHPDLLQRPKVEQTTDVVNIMRGIEDMRKNIDYKEVFYAIYLNQSGRVLSVGKVAEGTTTHCLVNIRQILQGALLQNATGLIVTHCHPSGCSHPSPEDIAVSKQIQHAAQLLSIKLLDSIILTSFDYFSFAENGLF